MDSKQMMMMMYLMMMLLLPLCNSSSNISPFCVGETSPAGDFRAECKEWVKDAKTWEEAMTNAFNAVIQIANNTKPVALANVAGQELNKYYNITKESRNSTCSRAFDAYVHYLNLCLDLVNVNDPYKAVDVYLAFDHFASCTNTVNDVPELDLFINYNEMLRILWQAKPQFQN